MTSTAAVITSEQDFEAALADDIGNFVHDPLGHVYFAYPWSEPGTELEHEEGPRQWQIDLLTELGEKLRAGEINHYEAIQFAVASGHGIGKSALVAWLIKWAMDTFVDCKGVVTANTESQLKTKTWAELAKWHRLSITEHWFKYTATALYSSDPKHEKTWRIDMSPWSERNTEAFAGLHNKRKRLLLIYDEASAIPDAIWEVSEGALTDEDTEIIWCAFGNPTRAVGRFRACFGEMSSFWRTFSIDSRDVPGTNKRQIQKWIDHYGEDDDFVRVRVRGMFPRISDTQLFSEDAYRAAAERELTPPEFAQYPKILSIDVARFGMDNTVFTLRQGPKLHWQKEFHGLRNTEVAGKARDFYGENKGIIAIPVDGPGVGGGVCDLLSEWKMPVVEVQPAATAPEPDYYMNMRAWIFEQCKNWFETADVPGGSSDLWRQMAPVLYGYNPRMQKRIMSSEDIKDEIGKSPDLLASLCLSFAPIDAVALPQMEKLLAARRRSTRRKGWGAHT